MMTRVNSRFYKIRETPTLVDFHYCIRKYNRNDLKLWNCNVKICIDKWKRIKLLNIFTGKHLQTMQNKIHALI